MAERNTEPRYDNDYVTLGYLRRNGATTVRSGSTGTVSGMFSTQPTPPYYVGDLWTDGSDLYICTTARSTGSFVATDWALATGYTDDTVIDDFIDNVFDAYELYIPTQTDGKMESFYQDADPSVDWTNESLKQDHVGDIWYDTGTLLQYRYVAQEGSNPILFGWIRARMPLVLYNVVTGHTNIFTVEPSNYDINDLWVSDGRIFTSNTTSVAYNAAHWADLKIGVVPIPPKKEDERIEYEQEIITTTKQYSDISFGLGVITSTVASKAEKTALDDEIKARGDAISSLEQLTQVIQTNGALTIKVAETESKLGVITTNLENTFIFDDDGFTIKQLRSPVTSTMDADGFSIKNGSDTISSLNTTGLTTTNGNFSETVQIGTIQIKKNTNGILFK